MHIFFCIKNGRKPYLQQVSHSQVHHEHDSLLGFFDVDPEHPQCQHITQKARC